MNVNIRVFVLAEGGSEGAFVTRVLGPHFQKFGIQLHSVVLPTGTDRISGGIRRGGVSRYKSIEGDINKILYDCRFSEVYLTTMLDLYGLPNDFPGFDSLLRSVSIDPYTRVQYLENALSEKWSTHPQGSCLIPYIQLHEFEALLLCDASAFDWEFIENIDAKRISDLSREISEFSSPELINETPNNAPSKRIIRHLPDYANRKKSASAVIAEKIGLKKMRDKCPHFDAWVTRIEQLSEV